MKLALCSTIFNSMLVFMSGYKRAILFSFHFPVLAILVSCIPIAIRDIRQISPAPSSTRLHPSATSTFQQTSTSVAALPSSTGTTSPSQTLTSTAVQALSPTVQFVQPTLLFISPTVFRPPRPTRTYTSTPSVSPTVTETAEPTGTAEPDPTICPIATQEIFFVEPVTSPTDQLTQVINVKIGNGEEVTVITESGTFSVNVNGTNGFQVEISLLPNTVHHLEVIGRVRLVTNWDGCVYGGYTMSTTSDRYNNSLIIVQGISTP
jgi:hypothetical protein